MITSKDNERIKHLKKLYQKKYRDKTNEFLVFGEHLIEEATKHGTIKEIYTTNNKLPGYLISKSIMRHLTNLKSIPERLAVCIKTNKNYISDKVLILEDIQDPTNVGALLRSASAFGFKKVLMSEKCADIYNDKVIQTSKGAIFHLDVKRLNIYDEILKLQKDGYHILATSLKASNELPDERKVALILGNEGKGVSEKAINLSNSLVKIKTETVESLNVSIAGSILMYEWSLR